MDVRKARPLVGCTGLAGFETIDRVLKWTRPPSAKPAQLPRHHIGFWGHHPQAVRRDAGGQARGYAPGAFRLQHRRRPLPRLRRGGRAHHRDGFLPDVKVPCEACHGRASTPKRWPSPGAAKHWRCAADGGGRGRGFFAAMPSHRPPAATARDVGLGCLTLGQPSPRSAAARRSASSW